MDISLYYEERGAGFPLVLLHGNGESHEYFARQMEPFSRAFRVLAPDTRGHGRSPRGEGAFTLRRFADDLYDFLRARGIERAHILGFSDGGNLAIKFALQWPQMVEKLILNGANVEMFLGVKPQVQLPIYAGYGVASLFSRISRKAARKRDVLGLMVHPYGVRMDDLARLEMPTLIIVGEHDMIKDRQTREMAAHIPHCRVEVFRDGDHFVAAKQPSRFNRTVMEFILGR